MPFFWQIDENRHGELQALHARIGCDYAFFCGFGLCYVFGALGLVGVVRLANRVGLADVDQHDLNSRVVLVRLVQGLGLRGRLAERGSRIARHENAYDFLAEIAGKLDFIGSYDRNFLAFSVGAFDENGEFEVC